MSNHVNITAGCKQVLLEALDGMGSLEEEKCYDCEDFCDSDIDKNLDNSQNKIIYCVIFKKSSLLDKHYNMHILETWFMETATFYDRS